ncbi:MAG: hypothetical protein LBT48_05810 [Prevotellaceae bacterium]|jgi:hypothetical protein|nr:hypothetical protein [Prevotellaceae bacterium]
MNTNQTANEDTLKTLFGYMPAETLPGNFQANTMQRIHQEAISLRKRKQRLQLIGLIAGLSAIIGIGVFVFIQYVDINNIITIRRFKTNLLSLSIPPMCIQISVIALILLIFDMLFRQMYYKRHRQNY